jgi:hypothetical protein
MLRKLCLLAALGSALAGPGPFAQPTAAPQALAELSSVVLPDALLAVVLDLRLLRSSTRLQELWNAATLAQPEVRTQIAALEAGLGIKLEEDLDAVVLSTSAKGSVLAFVGRLPEAKIVEAARGEKLTVTKDAAASVPLYLAKAEKGEPLALAFPPRALLLGAEADVRATLGSNAPREAASLLTAGGPHLLAASLAGVDRLLAEQAKTQPTPPAASTPAAQAVQKLSSLSAGLDLDRKLDLFLRAGFSTQEAATTLQQVFQQAIEQTAASPDPQAREAAKGMKLGLEGSTLSLTLGLSAAQMAHIVRDAQRDITAQKVTHVETGLELRLPRMPSAWTLQPAQDKFGSFWKAALPKGDGFVRVQSYDISKEPNWTIEKEAEDLAKRVQGAAVLANRFVEAGGTKAHCLEVSEGTSRHRYEQFAKDGKLYLLIGSTNEGSFHRLGEEMDFIVGQILEPPAQQGTSPAESTAALLKASAELQRQNLNYQIMSNILQMQHETSMAIIYNMGGGYHYEYRYR